MGRRTRSKRLDLNTDAAVAAFARDGFLVVPGALPADEVDAWNRTIDADMQRFPRLWRQRGEGGRSQSVHALLSCPELDVGIFHPSMLLLVERLVGGDVVCEEHSVMQRGPIEADPPDASWHRDTGHDVEHELAIRNLSLIYYLSDVDATTHCFAAVPESVEQKTTEEALSCDGTGAQDLLGPAGTAILFNAGSCHAGRLRVTDQRRRTVHIYYGHAANPPLSEHTIFPQRLVRHNDEAVRRLFRRPNEVTRAVTEQQAAEQQAAFEQQAYSDQGE